MAHLIKKSLPVAAAVTAALAAPQALAVYGEDFEFHGYLRSGVGWSSEGGDQVCTQLPGVRVKYRLGNECENYLETVFNANLFKADDGAYFKLFLTFAYVPEGENDFEQYDPALRESWIEAGNVAGGALEGARFWAGKRFYRRHDVHINDWYFWDVSGPGAGIEDITAGPGKLALAVFHNVNDELFGDVDAGASDIKASITRFDARFYGLETNPGGQLTVGLDYRVSDEDDADELGVDNDNFADDGWTFTVMHFQDGVLGGFNKVALQYGRGLGAQDLGRVGGDNPIGVDDGDDAWRIVEQLMFNPNPNLSGLVHFTYEDDDNRGEWLSVGVRPKFHFTDYFNVAVEVGYDSLDPEGSDDTLRLWKVAVAPQLSAGRGFWARPLLRAYVNYQDWNDDARDAGLAGGSDGPFGDDTSGWNFGIQAESWW